MADLRGGRAAPVGWHALRHTFCSHLAMRGAAPAALTELAGHTPGMLRDTLRLLDRIGAQPHGNLTATETKNPAAEGGIHSGAA